MCVQLEVGWGGGSQAHCPTQGVALCVVLEGHVRGGVFRLSSLCDGHGQSHSQSPSQVGWFGDGGGSRLCQSSSTLMSAHLLCPPSQVLDSAGNWNNVLEVIERPPALTTRDRLHLARWHAAMLAFENKMGLAGVL